MIAISQLLGLVILFAICIINVQGETLSVADSQALIDYVRTPDSHYNLRQISCDLKGDGWTGYYYNLTSQAWLRPEDSSIHIWTHGFLVIVPALLDQSHLGSGLLLISGGSNRSPDECPNPKKAEILEAAMIAQKTRTIVAIIGQVPNEPAVFYEDPNLTERSEDAIIAWTWHHFLKNQNDALWLLRMPMVKAAVRAMDSFSAVTEKLFGVTTSSFVVTGASKRGWTTWLTPVVDPRVKGIIPMVLDELHFSANLKRHYRAYGGWSFALKDYINLNITLALGSSGMDKLEAIVDPYAYRDILTVPKLVISAPGDEFLLLDNVNFFFNDLNGEKHFRAMMNCDHYLTQDVVGLLDTISSFALAVIEQVPRPQYKWTFDADGTINVFSSINSPQPNATLWYAYTIDGNTRRDFRLITLQNGKPAFHPVLWFSKELQPTVSADGYYYKGKMDAPASGWVGFIVKLEYPGPQGTKFEFTSGPSILPQTYPYPDCQGDQCLGPMV